MSDQRPFLVLGFRRRSLADLAGYDMHATRAGGDRRHVDPARTHLNRSLLEGRAIGEARAAATLLAEQMAVQNLAKKIAGLKKRRRTAEIRALRDLAAARGAMAAAGSPWDAKNSQPFFDGILSASPGFFAAAPGAPPPPAPAPGTPLGLEEACARRGWDPERVERWVDCAREWLVQTFGDDLLDVRLDLDEQTPHIHFVGAPRVVDGKGRAMLSQRQHRVLGERKSNEDERESYERVLDEAAVHFAPLGLVRGARNAARARTRIAAARELTVEALTPAEGRRRGAALLGAAVLERGEILAQAAAEGEALVAAAQTEAGSEVAFAAHRAEVLLGATDLVIEGQLRTRAEAPGTLFATPSAPVAAFSARFAPTEHDPARPQRGLFAALRGTGLMQTMYGLAERMRAIVMREQALEARAAALAARAREVEAEGDAAEADRQAAAEERADAAFERAEATALLEKAAAAGDRVAAAELARSRVRGQRQRTR